MPLPLQGISKGIKNSFRVVAAGIALLLATIAIAKELPTETPQPPIELLQGNTQTLKAGKLKTSPLNPDTRQWVFYYGASWCGPCRAFMPELRAAHQKWAEQGNAIQLVFVSGDGSCEAMQSYVQQMRMPWPVISCRKRAALTAIRGLGDGSLPGMIVVDADGEVIDSSYWPEQYGKYRRVLQGVE